MAKVVISLEVDADGAVQGYTAAAKGAKTAGDAAGEATTKSKGFFASLKEGVAMGAGFAAFDKVSSSLTSFVSGFADMATKAAAGGGALADIMQKTGLEAKGLSGELALAATTSGSSVEGIASAVGVLQKNIVAGSSSIKMLGLDVKDLQNLKPEEAFKKTAQALLEIKNPTEQDAAAMALFKKSGQEMLPVMKAIASGAGEMATAIHAGLSDSEVSSLDNLDDSITTVGLSWERLQEHVIAVINQNGLLSDSVTAVAKVIGSASGWIETHKDQIVELAGAVKTLAGEGFDYLGKAATGAAAGVQVLWSGLADATGLNAILALDKALDGMIGKVAKLAAVGAVKGAFPILSGLADIGAAKQQYDFDNYKTQATPEQLAALNGTPAASTKVADNTKSIDQLDAEADARNEALDKKNKAANEKAAAEAKAAKEKAYNDDLAMSKHNYDLQLKVGKEFNDRIAAMGQQKSGEIIQNYLQEQQAADAAAQAEYEATVEWNQKTAEYQERLRQEMAAKRAEDLARQVDGARMLAGALAEIGSQAGGAFGAIATLGAGALDVFANLNDQAIKSASTLQKVGMAAQGAIAAYKSGSFLGGAASGAAAGAAFGPWGAVIGGVAGGILGLFGGGKKKKAEEEAKRKQALDQGTKDLQSLVDQYHQIQRQFAAEGAGKDGLGAMFDNFSKGAKGTQAQLDRLSRMGAVSLESLKKAGYSTSEAFDLMGDTIDSAIEAAKKKGLKLTGPLAAMADFRGKIKKNQESVDAGSGLGTYLKGARSTGSLDQAATDDAEAQLKDLTAQYKKAGFTADQIGSLLAEPLYELKNAAASGKVALDDETQAMINAAQAGGAFDGLVDPMAQMLEIQKAMLETTAALTQALGGSLPDSVRKLIDELNNIPTDVNVDVNVDTNYTGGAPPGAPSSGGPEKGKYNPDVTAAAGYGPRKLSEDTTFLAHKGEHVLIVPAGQSFKSASSGFGQAFGIAAGEHVPGTGLGSFRPSMTPVPQDLVRLAAVLQGGGTRTAPPSSTQHIQLTQVLHGTTARDADAIARKTLDTVARGLRRRTSPAARTAVKLTNSRRNA